MAITLDSSDAQYLVVGVSHMVQHLDAQEMKQKVLAHVSAHGTFKALVRLEDNFIGIDPHSDWSDTAADEELQTYVQQIAIVGDEKWQDHALLFFLSGLLPIPIKFFKNAHEDLARAWLGDARYYANVE
jgi:hypothetical protein